MAEPILIPEPELQPEPTPAPKFGRGIPRILIAASTLAVIGFIGFKGPTLWAEFQALRRDWAGDRDTRLVGYVGIHPVPSFAKRPADWVHDDASDVLLWAGWRDQEGHRWFRIARGDLDPERLWGFFGRDAIRAIDQPLAEIGGGDVWDRIPYNAAVGALDLDGQATAYPVRMIEKVMLINDATRARPVLVAYNPQAPAGRAMQAFEASIDGQRVTLGHSGYNHDAVPLLYDRGTESLWLEEADGLRAVAGPRKGLLLKRLATLGLLDWADWRSRFPNGRLVIGANRAVAMPDR